MYHSIRISSALLKVSTRGLWKWRVTPGGPASSSTSNSDAGNSQSNTAFRLCCQPPVIHCSNHWMVRLYMLMVNGNCFSFCNGTANKIYCILTIIVFWGVTSCRFVGKYKRFGRTCWRIPPKSWYISTRPRILGYSSLYSYRRQNLQAHSIKNTLYWIIHLAWEKQRNLTAYQLVLSV
jgi:hypothetical protein